MVIFSSESRISSDSALGSIAVHLQLKLKETLQRFHERRRAGKKINVSCMFKVQHTMFQKVKNSLIFKEIKIRFFLSNSTLLKKFWKMRDFWKCFNHCVSGDQHRRHQVKVKWREKGMCVRNSHETPLWRRAFWQQYCSIANGHSWRMATFIQIFISFQPSFF